MNTEHEMQTAVHDLFQGLARAFRANPDLEYSGVEILQFLRMSVTHNLRKFDMKLSTFIMLGVLELSFIEDSVSRLIIHALDGAISWGLKENHQLFLKAYEKKQRRRGD